MESHPPRVFTIMPGADFLGTLARAVLDGFPAGTPPGVLDIARTTILLPTRRATRALEQIFAAAKGGPGLLLPRIRPIGDIDEELFDDDPSTEDQALGLPEAISPAARDFLLIGLIAEWARDNPDEPLAREIAAAPQQSFNLARSLAELVDGLETEELDWNRFPELHQLDQARHRAAILSFLDLVKQRLPARLADRGLMGAMARRAARLRREARRLADSPPRWPVIAAGSTGSIPATRALLEAIARAPAGALVLPGLDLMMDDASWAAVGEQHPQFALKQLLEALRIERKDVAVLGPAASARDWLGSEIMRPPATSEGWRRVLADGAARLADGMAGIELVEARDHREEAQAIALILRRTLATPGETAALVTPDRELARRVKQQLAAVGVAVDDSAGEPLARFDGACLIDLLIEVIAEQASPETLLALLRHPLCDIGATLDEARRATDVLEVAVFRTALLVPTLGGLAAAVAAARDAIAADPHPPLACRSFTTVDWESAAAHAAALAAAIAPLLGRGEAPLAEHLAALTAAAETLAGPALWQGEAGELLRLLLDRLMADAVHLPRCPPALALAILRHHLNATPLRRTAGETPRLAILGLLEARLARPDVIVLGGLNEGVWPALPDAGPWLNRPMREEFGMAQPERQIGQTAHDFQQALGVPRCHLVWAARLSDAPAVPSRWLLRIGMLAGRDKLPVTPYWTRLARQLLQPASGLAPIAKPRPRPPATARLRRLSVTGVETLQRDPYAIYARDILSLEPLADIGTKLDFGTRGSLFHAVIGAFNSRFPVELPAQAVAEVMKIAAEAFAPFRNDPEIAAFWWGQIARIAPWFVAEERQLREGLARIHTEIGGRFDMTIAGGPFALTARADRIDELADGTARIVDYKTGRVPTGEQVKADLAPQLTLEAAMLAAGAFAGLPTRQTSDILYIRLSGGNPPGEVKRLKLDGPVMALAERHLAGLKALLAAYADPARPFLPRVMTEKEDDVLAYDHLSRFREWALSGSAP